jgi:hypothetical protein
MLRLLRRIAVLALVAAALLTMPRALCHYGALGPTAQRVEATRQAVEVARGCGARPGSRLAEAGRILRVALLAQKDHHEARHGRARAGAGRGGRRPHRADAVRKPSW